MNASNGIEINARGVYIEQRTGTLLRVSEDAVVHGRSPIFEIVPFLPLTTARMIAADVDLYF